MRKSLICIALVLALLLCLLPGQAQASSVIASGTFGDFTWTLEDGTLTLSGSGVFDTGDMEANSDENPWDPIALEVRKLVISEGVTGLYGDVMPALYWVEEISLPSTLYYLEPGVLPHSASLSTIQVHSANPYFCIADQALYSMDMTTLHRFPAARTGSYSVPQGVTTIADAAFVQSSLTKVVLPEGVTSIGSYAFYKAHATSVTLPKSLTQIGNYGFSWSDLTSVALPDGLLQIGNFAFSDCWGLTSIDIPGSVAHIGDYAFAFCEYLSDAVLREGVSYIGEHAFFCCSNLTDLTIPGSLKNISSSAFSYCEQLAEVLLPEGVESVANSAFYYSSVKQIEIPASVRYIGSDAFDHCPLESIRIDPDNPVYSVIGLVLFNKTQTRLVRFMDWDAVSYTIPNSVTDIYAEAFRNCDQLREIKLSNSLVRISDRVFKNCPLLTHMEFPSTLGYLGDYIFEYSDGLTTMFFSGSAPISEASPFGTYDPEIDWTGDDRLIATAYYPADDPSWTREARNALGGNITWVPYDNPFRDLSEGSFCYVPVIWAVENGITNGLSGTTFGPTASCNRAQVVTFLWRAAGSPEPRNTSHPFVDVKEGAYYYKAMLWAVENGITNGTDATHFSPNKLCDRATVVTFLWRAQHKPAPTLSQSPFTDVTEGRFYYDAVLWAVENAITSGTSPASFSPTSTCNRGQVVTFLYRAYA